MKDRVDKGEIDIQHCPTKSMLADFFTKPLQGELFRKFRQVIMGWKTLDSLYDEENDMLGDNNIVQQKSILCSNKERVGKNILFDYKIMMNQKGEKIIYAEVVKKKEKPTYAEVLKKNISLNVLNVAEERKK